MIVFECGCSQYSVLSHRLNLKMKQIWPHCRSWGFMLKIYMCKTLKLTKYSLCSIFSPTIAFLIRSYFCGKQRFCELALQHWRLGQKRNIWQWCRSLAGARCLWWCWCWPCVLLPVPVGFSRTWGSFRWSNLTASSARVCCGQRVVRPWCVVLPPAWRTLCVSASPIPATAQVGPSVCLLHLHKQQQHR